MKFYEPKFTHLSVRKLRLQTDAAVRCSYQICRGHHALWRGDYACCHILHPLLSLTEYRGHLLGVGRGVALGHIEVGRDGSPAGHIDDTLNGPDTGGDGGVPGLDLHLALVQLLLHGVLLLTGPRPHLLVLLETLSSNLLGFNYLYFVTEGNKGRCGVIILVCPSVIFKVK